MCTQCGLELRGASPLAPRWRSRWVNGWVSSCLRPCCRGGSTRGGAQPLVLTCNAAEAWDAHRVCAPGCLASPTPPAHLPSPRPSPQAGPEPVTLLRWSPCGCYLLAAHPGGEFEIWETQVGMGGLKGMLLRGGSGDRRAGVGEGAGSRRAGLPLLDCCRASPGPVCSAHGAVCSSTTLRAPPPTLPLPSLPCPVSAVLVVAALGGCRGQRRGAGRSLLGARLALPAAGLRKLPTGGWVGGWVGRQGREEACAAGVQQGR